MMKSEIDISLKIMSFFSILLSYLHNIYFFSSGFTTYKNTLD